MTNMERANILSKVNMWYPKEVKIKLGKSNYCGRGCTQQRKLIRNNTILLGSLDEKEIILVNAHKFKSYLTWGTNDGPIT
jgi:hypothetical protein